jgi:hypothetical protein
MKINVVQKASEKSKEKIIRNFIRIGTEEQ